MPRFLGSKEPMTREDICLLLHEIVDLLAVMPGKMASINMEEPEEMLHEDFADCKPTSLVEMFIFSLFIVIQERGDQDIAANNLHEVLRDFMANNNYLLLAPKAVDESIDKDEWPNLISDRDH